MENLVCWYPIILLRAEQMTIFTSNSLPEAAVSHTFLVPQRSHFSLPDTGTTGGLAAPTPKFMRIGKT